GRHLGAAALTFPLLLSASSRVGRWSPFFFPSSLVTAFIILQLQGGRSHLSPSRPAPKGTGGFTMTTVITGTRFQTLLVLSRQRETGNGRYPALRFSTYIPVHNAKSLRKTQPYVLNCL